MLSDVLYMFARLSVIYVINTASNIFTFMICCCMCSDYQSLLDRKHHLKMPRMTHMDNRY